MRAPMAVIHENYKFAQIFNQKCLLGLDTVHSDEKFRPEMVSWKLFAF